MQPNNEDHSGSTAITAFVTPTHIVVANCGDSRAILVGTDRNCIFASEDHKPYNEDEKRRIEGAGGSVSMKRVNGDLAVSRALGDFVYKQNKPDGATLAPPDNQQVSCIPEVTIIPRREDMAFLVLCCDGIWDVMTNEMVAKLVMEVRCAGVGGCGCVGVWVWVCVCWCVRALHPLPFAHGPLSSHLFSLFFFHPSPYTSHVTSPTPRSGRSLASATAPWALPKSSSTRAWTTRARTT
jgi:hypothetical protein